MSEDICGLYLSITRDVQRVWRETNSPLLHQVLPYEVGWIIGYIDESKFLRAKNEAALANAIDEDVRQFGTASGRLGPRGWRGEVAHPANAAPVIETRSRSAFEQYCIRE